MKTYISFLLAGIMGFSSCSSHYCRKGDAYYKTMQYDKAITSYNKGMGKKPTDEIKTKLATSYRMNNDYKNAERYYAELSTLPKTEPINHFYYGKILMSNGKYKEAKKAFLNYLILNDSDRVAETLIISCDSSSRHYADSSHYEIKTLEFQGVSTAFAQTNFGDGIVFSADKETHKKTSGWTGRSYLDLYFSHKSEDGIWTAPEPLKGSINGPYHEGPAVFTKERTKVYFTRSNYSSSKKLKKNNRDESNLKVFSAELEDGIWTNLKELPFNSDEYSCGHPALSPDEKTLYFISDMPRGQGGTDLYKVSLTESKDKKETWSSPENLGNTINTPGNEMFPYVHNNGTLYFSSDAWNTLGGLDIFSSSPEANSWSAPQNLNYPINTPQDDFAFTLNDDGRTGYISSNRDELDKIYEISLADPVFSLKGKVTKKQDGNPLPDVVVEITTNKDKYIHVLSADDFGHYSMKLKAGMEYKIQAIKDGYLKPGIITVSTENNTRSEVFKADFQLEKLQMEKTISLENIYYDLDKWTIREDAARELDKFVALLNENPQISVQMNSHTDSRATDDYNLQLSEKRAEAAVEYLIKKGIASHRLRWKGYGETALINDCGNGTPCAEQLHQQNRRTEFKITEVSELASGKR